MQTTGRWKLGLALALLTSFLWGVLPVTLKLTLEGIDPYTIIWYRFAVPALVLAIVLGATGALPPVRSLGRRGWLILAIGLGGLLANYVFYLLGLHHSTPTMTQTLIQLAPFFFLLGSLIAFGERFSKLQWVGAVVLVVGLVLFFNRRLPELLEPREGMGLGVVFILLAAVTWAIYGVAQKALLKRLSPQQILLTLYIGAIVLLFPLAEPAVVTHASFMALATLAFACFNTLVAYGAFAEALRHWEASRIGAILATAPLVTMMTMWVMDHVFPGFVAPEGLNAMSACGALLVVGGSSLSALASRSESD